MGEVKQSNGVRVPRPKLSATIDPEHMAFIVRTAEECNKDRSVVVDQLIADGRRYWDLTARQKGELGRELALLRDDQKRINARLEQVARWVGLLLAQQNLGASLRYEGGPVTAAEAPASFGRWAEMLDEILGSLEEGE